MERVGGPCPDPLRCRYWTRMVNGPWTCEHCHPPEPNDLLLKHDDRPASRSVAGPSAVEQEMALV